MRKMIKKCSEKSFYNVFLNYYKSEVNKKGCMFIETENILGQLSNIVRLLFNGNRCGLFIRGVVGNGKTTSVHALKNTINTLVSNHYFHEGEVFSWDWMKIVSAREMISMYINDRETKAFTDIKRCTWLAIDDVGTDPSDLMLYGTVFHPFVELIDYRYENRLPTIIVSNFKKDELKSIYNDERFSDRFSEMFNSTTFRDDSYRRK